MNRRDNIPLTVVIFVDTGARLLFHAPPCTLRVRGVSVTISSTCEGERQTEGARENESGRWEGWVSRSPRGARGQGATDVLPHDARQGGRPLRRSSLASGGVCARHVAEAEVHGCVLAKDRAGEGPPWTKQVNPIHLGEFCASTPDSTLPRTLDTRLRYGMSRPFFRNVESSTPWERVRSRRYRVIFSPRPKYI